MEEARIFVTDYSSYNRGEQFKFGHWVDLSEFLDAEDLAEYIREHLAEADSQSPLPYGAKREEPMITDFEGFPEELYHESMGREDFERIYEYIELEEVEKLAYSALLDLGYSPDAALRDAGDVHPVPYDRTVSQAWNLFEEYNPEAASAAADHEYISFNHEDFINNEFYRYDAGGRSYLIPNYQLR